MHFFERLYISQLWHLLITCSSAKQGNHGAKGWPDSAYGVSKIGVTVMSFAQQREFDKDSRQDLVLNPVSTKYSYNKLGFILED